MTDDDYKARLAQYLKEQGPNPNQGMAARWAWNVKKEREFNRMVENENLQQSTKARSSAN